MAFQYVNETAFIGSAMLGGMMHYMKKFLRKETKVSLLAWFSHSNWLSTFYTTVMFIFVIIGALAGGIINAQTDIWAALYTGFATGFAVDAGFNSDRSITSQLNEVKDETGELFDRDDDLDNDRFSNRYSGRDPGRDRTRPDRADPNPQLDDASGPAHNEPPKKRRDPVDGSPRVRPRPIE